MLKNFGTVSIKNLHINSLSIEFLAMLIFYSIFTNAIQYQVYLYVYI